MPAKNLFSKLVAADRNRLPVGRFNMERIPKTRIPKGMKSARELLAQAQQIEFKISFQDLKHFFNQIDWKGVMAFPVNSRQIIFVPKEVSDRFLALVKSGEIKEITRKANREQNAKKPKPQKFVPQAPTRRRIAHFEELGARKSFKSIQTAIMNRQIKLPFIHVDDLALLLGVKRGMVERLVDSGQFQKVSENQVDFNSVRKLFELKPR